MKPCTFTAFSFVILSANYFDAKNLVVAKDHDVVQHVERVTRRRVIGTSNQVRIREQISTNIWDKRSNQVNSRYLGRLSDIFSLYGKSKDEPEDADADDYYKLTPEEEEVFLNKTITNTTMWINQTSVFWSKIIPKSSRASSTQWYELSHYVEPDSVMYDVIEGFLIALLLCLIVATCYIHCYYYCLTRLGLCPDDRIYKSLLHRKGRKVRELLMERRRRKKLQRRSQRKAKICCSFSLCCTKKESIDQYGQDGRGLFAPLTGSGGGRDRHENDFDDESLDSYNSDDSSSLSQDSALSLEYGDKTLNDDDGENTERLTESKLDNAAKTFFEQEEKKEQMKKNTKQVSILLAKARKRLMKGGARSIGSRRSRRSRGTSVRSQASSILSSESGSLSSFNGSSSDEDDDHSLEMESAMMDLELAEKRMGTTG